MRTIVEKNLSLLCALSFLIFMMLGMVTVPFAGATDLNGTVPASLMTLQTPLTDANSFVLIAAVPVVTKCEDLKAKYVASCCPAPNHKGKGGVCTTLYNKVLATCGQYPVCP